MYPGGGRGFFGGNYKRGGTSWTDDYPRGDRTFVQMLRRFTRTNVRGVEQPIDLDDGDVDYWPFMVVGLAQAWQLTDEQAATLREYLLRGGFLFCDSFFGGGNWSVFEESLKRVFPDRPIVDLTDDHPIFHTVFDLPHMTTVQIPNWNSLERGGPGYLGYDGKVPRWRGVIGEDGRLMVLIAYNNDVMDGWQWADDPRYPAEEANLSLRLGVNASRCTRSRTRPARRARHEALRATLEPVPHGGITWSCRRRWRATRAVARGGVRGTVNGAAYRSSPMMYSGIFHLGVHKATLAAGRDRPARVTVTIELDDEPLPADVCRTISRGR
jgi:hypothetical protein